MNLWSNDWRDRQAYLKQPVMHHTFERMHHTVPNYSDTDAAKKPNLASFENKMLSKIHSIPDPLKKNLADTMITGSSKQTSPETPTEGREFYYEANLTSEMSVSMENPTTHRRDFYPSFTGITSFISNVLGSISDAMFHRRSKSPVSQYDDCSDFDSHTDQEMAAENWKASNFADQIKKRFQEQSGAANNDMNNCRAAVAQVEDKISVVRDLLSNKTVQKASKTNKRRQRRPRRAFVEAGSASDSYEEDITPDNYVSLDNDDYVEYIAIPNNENQLFCNIKAAKMKTELGIAPETTDIVKVLPDTQKEMPPQTVEPEENKKEIIASCEDKVAKLKAMLLERKNKPVRVTMSVSDTKLAEKIPQKTEKQSKVIPIEKKQDKNPCRLTDKRKKSKIKKNIQDNMVFANEIDSEEISSSVDDSPATKSCIQRISEVIKKGQPIDSEKDYFDETKGRFHSASDSEDSFQIVFSESPKHTRLRKPSDCDSEDSFIVFQDSPDSCYTSNNLFSDHCSDESESDDDSDTESEVSDSGGVDLCKLSHSLSRTMSDLTDDNLFDDSKRLEDTSVIGEIENDEVDCAFRSDCVQGKELSPVKEESPEIDSDSARHCSGLLIDEAKKLERKGQPRKAVSFSEKPPKVHVMRVWSFAARQARAGHWERYSLDRERFKRRIADVDMAISWVLNKQHRNRVMFQRFMPWWNKLKRIEAAEKKQREEEEKIRKEEERIKKEREDIIEGELNEEMDVIKGYDAAIDKYFNDKFEKEEAEKKLRAVLELKSFLDKDKKKLARKKEREMKMESEMNKLKMPNGVVPLKGWLHL